MIFKVSKFQSRQTTQVGLGALSDHYKHFPLSSCRVQKRDLKAHFEPSEAQTRTVSTADKQQYVTSI